MKVAAIAKKTGLTARAIYKQHEMGQGLGLCMRNQGGTLYAHYKDVEEYMRGQNRRTQLKKRSFSVVELAEKMGLSESGLRKRLKTPLGIGVVPLELDCGMRFIKSEVKHLLKKKKK